MVGVLLVLLGSGAWRGFVEPGPLTSAHARLVECKSCHAAALGSPLGWVAAAFGAAAASPTDGERCVRCHSVGANAFSPHGLPKGELTRLRDIAAAAPSGATMPLMLVWRAWRCRPAKASFNAASATASIAAPRLRP